MQIRKTNAALTAERTAPQTRREFVVTVSGDGARTYEVRAARTSADALISALDRHPNARGIAIRALHGGEA